MTKANKKDVCGTVFVALGVLMLAGCFTLWWHNTREDLDAETAVMQNLPMVQQAIEERVKEAASAEPDYLSMIYQDATDDQQVKEMTVVEIDGYGYIGYLTFPTLDTELPVLDRCDSRRLRISPCLYYGSCFTDNLVIAAHNYRSSFGKLKKINRGDEVYFTDMDGTVHAYIVEDIEMLDGDAVGLMIDSNWALSLYTCTYDGSQRLTVRCSRVA